MNGIKLIIIILLTLQKLYKSNNDVFLTLEKGFNCKNINNNIFEKIHHQNEKKIFNSNIPFLLYITSSWCDYCCQETKILTYLQNNLYNSKNPLINNIKIYLIQSDEYIDIIKKYKIFLAKIPSLFLVKNNDEIIQYSSFFRKKDILYFIEKNLSPIQTLNTIKETINFLDNSNKKIKLIGFFIDKKKYLKEYSEFIKYSKEVNYRIDVEIKICFNKDIAIYLNDEYKLFEEQSMNSLLLKRYENIFILDLSLKGKYINDFIYYNTFSPVEEISKNNNKIIKELKVPVVLFFIDTTYNLNNFHNILHYLEKLSYEFKQKYVFTYMDGGAKSDIKIKLGLDDNFPSLIIHYFDKKEGIKFPYKEKILNDKNIRLFLQQNLNNNNIFENKKIKNKKILNILKKYHFLNKEYYINILFNNERKKDLLLFIIDEYSFNEKDLNFCYKLINIMDIINEYGINFYIDIYLLSKYELIEYKFQIKNDINMELIEYLINSKTIVYNKNINFPKRYEIELINEYDFIISLNSNIINKFKIPKKNNYYEELYYTYKYKYNNINYY